MSGKQERMSYAKKPPSCDVAQGGGFGGFRTGVMPRRELLRLAGIDCRYATVSLPASSRRLMAFTKSRVPVKTSCV